jgi:hypothetical protein
MLNATRVAERDTCRLKYLSRPPRSVGQFRTGAKVGGDKSQIRWTSDKAQIGSAL